LGAERKQFSLFLSARSFGSTLVVQFRGHLMHAPLECCSPAVGQAQASASAAQRAILMTLSTTTKKSQPSATSTQLVVRAELRWTAAAAAAATTLFIRQADGWLPPARKRGRRDAGAAARKFLPPLGTALLTSCAIGVARRRLARHQHALVQLKPARYHDSSVRPVSPFGSWMTTVYGQSSASSSSAAAASLAIDWPLFTGARLEVRDCRHGFHA
jgi:hypothetical protein